MARGDHIKVKRFRGLYSHHGIDMGDGTVVHFDGEPFRGQKAKVTRSPMEEFLKGQPARPVRHKDAVRPEDETVLAALERMGESGYHLFLNNCEHFAHACRTGAAKSRQVERAVRVGLAAVAGVAVVGGALVLTTALAKKNASGKNANGKKSNA